MHPDKSFRRNTVLFEQVNLFKGDFPRTCVRGRVLISHDAGWYSVGELNGGSIRPYTAIFTHLVSALKKQGFTEQQLDQLLVINPANAFSIRVRVVKK